MLRPMRSLLNGSPASRRLAAAMAVAGSLALPGCVTTDPSRGPAGGLVTASPAAARPPAFPVAETFIPGAAPAPQWTDVLARHGRAAADPTAVPSEWRRLVAALGGLDLRARLERANAEINRVPYARSEQNWSRRDYWETPFELIAGSGQCQDYAVAKYLLLRATGVPASDLRVVVVQDREAGLAHAVLLAYLDGRAMILDNQIPGVVPAARVAHYEPLYALSEDGWWIYDRTAGPGVAAALGRNAFAADS